MFKRQRHLFVLKKTPYKKLFFICITFAVLFGAVFFAHIYIKNKIKFFLLNQQVFFNKHNLKLGFKSSPSTSWSIWPQVVLVYPSLERKQYFNPKTVWQAKQATIFYTIWHPFSLAIQIDGEQLFCLNNNSSNCFQIHGSQLNIQIPLFKEYKTATFYLQSKEIFYTIPLQSTGNINSLRLKNISANLNLNLQKNLNESLIFFTVNIENSLVNSIPFHPQKFNNFKLQAALIEDKNSQNIYNASYKLLLQKIDFSWNNLSINSNGKFYLPYPQFIPTGEIFLHLNGIDQTIYQQLSSLNCCNQLKENLSQAHLPSQLNFTLFVRKGVFYLGAIPLQTIWYDHFINFINIHAK